MPLHRQNQSRLPGGDPAGRRRRYRGTSRRLKAPIAATLAATLVGALTFGSANIAVANENGTSQANVDSTTATQTTPSGLKATYKAQSLVDTSQVTNSEVSIQNATYFSDTPQTPAMSGSNAAKVGIGGATGTLVFAYPKSWSFDNQWHPAYRTTVTFDHPVTNPIMYLGTEAVGASDTEGTNRTGNGVVSTQVKVVNAQGPSGSVAVSASSLPGFNTGLYDVSSNTITPKSINGHVPYLSASNIYCEPPTPKTADQEYPLIAQAMPGNKAQINYISGPCGSIQLDTGGKAVTQLTVDTNLSYLGASTRFADGVWNGAAYTSTTFNFSVGNEVSGSTTPAGLGAATHVVGDLRLGDSIKRAFDGENITAAKAGTAADNSDAGYMPAAQIQRATLTNKTKGNYTLTVPYSGLSAQAYLNGWIDFNGNGQWDAGESASSIVTLPSGSSSGTATLTFAVPSDIAATPAGGAGATLRLRTAYDKADVQNPTGMARSGEVEDHFITIADATPDLLVTKTASVEGGGNAIVGSTIKYEITVANQSSTYDANDVTVVDTLPAGLTYLPNHADTSSGLTYDPQARTISWGPSAIGKGQTLTLTLFARADTVGEKTNTATASTPDGCQTSGTTGTSCTDDSTTDVDRTGELQIVKSTPGLDNDTPATLGQQITYRITVTNNSPEIMHNVAVADSKLEALGQTCTLTKTTLNPNDSAYCEMSYTVTQKDIDAGKILNKATASASWPDESDVPPVDDTKTTDTDGDAGHLVISKSSTIEDKNTQAAKGSALLDDIIHYTVTAKNNTAWDLQNVTLTDPRIPALGADCTLNDVPVTFPAAVPAGQSIICSGDYTVTAADVANGHVYNQATGTAFLPPDPLDPDTPRPVVVDPGDNDVPVGGLNVVKTSTLNGEAITAANPALRGDVIDYQVVLTNTTNYPMTNVTIADEMLKGTEALTCTPDPANPATARDLAAKASVTCTGSHTVTQADVDADRVVNVATASGDWGPRPDDSDVPESGWPTGPVTPGSDSTDDPTEHSPANLVVAKSSEVEGGGNAIVGSTIKYQIQVTNQSATRDAYDVTVVDTLPDGLTYLPNHADTSNGLTYDPDARTISWGPSTIGKGQTLTLTLFAKADTVGEKTNTATATTPDGCQTIGQTDQCTDDATTDVDRTGELRIVKSTPGLDDDTPATLGQQITYRVTVTNTSPETMSNVSVADPKLEALGQTCALDKTTLGPNESAHCDMPYTVTQQDIDAGKILNKATASATWPDESDVPPVDDTKTTDTDGDAGHLVITKSSTIEDKNTQATKSSAALGDIIHYTITAKNNTAWDLQNVTVTDPRIPALGTDDAQCTLEGNVVTFPASVPAGQSIVCSGDYTVTAADVANGHVYNQATGTGFLPPDPADPDTPRPVDVDPGDNDVPVGGLDVVKTSTLGGEAITAIDPAKVGDVIDYRVVVTNTTNFPMVNVTIADEMLKGTEALTCTPDPANPATARDLAAKASVTCTGSHTVTQADVDAGHVANLATASGDWGPKPDDPDTPDGGWPTGPVDPGTDRTDDPTNRDPGNIDVVKTSTIADGTSGAAKTQAAAGDVITYTIKATNKSNLTMSNVRLDDPMLPELGTSASSCTIDKPATANVTLPATLAPGSSVTCVANHTVTAADVAKGRVTNVVTANGDVPPPYDPADPGNTPTDPVPVDPATDRNDQPAGGLQVEKSYNSDGIPSVGGVIGYTITVTNTSDYPMVNVALTDQLLTEAHATLDCGEVDPSNVSMAAHASFTCTADYTVTQANVDAGRVVNTATADGEWGPKPADSPETNWPTGPVDPAGDTVDTPTAGPAAGDGLVVTKDAVVNGGAKAKAGLGDTITFFVTATNNSNLTMKNVTVKDEMLTKAGVALACEPGNPVASLAPHAKITCQADYQVTVADVNRGHVENIATASGKYPDDTDVPVTPGKTDTDTEDAAAPLQVTKVADSATVTSGQQVTYTIVAKNLSKDVIAKNVTITDPLSKDVSFVSADTGGSYDKNSRTVSWQVGSLKPGQSTTVHVTVKVRDNLPASAKVVNTAKAATPGGCAAGSPNDCTGTATTPAGSSAAASDGGILAHTGANIAVALSVVLGLLAAGFVLLRSGRRMASSHRH